MSKTNAMENGMLLLFFNNTDFANIGDAGGLQNSATAGSLYISLHTADPGEAGSQNTSECAYGAYARVAVARSGAGWTVSGNSVTNAGAITFPKCTSGSETVTHVGIGTDSAGAGTLLYSGPVGTVIQGPFTAKADDTITIPGHSLAVNERVSFYPAFGSSLPTGLTEGTIYWVITVSGEDITVSTTQGGGAVNITAVGDGVAVESQVLAVSINITPEIAASALTLTED